LYFHIRQPVAVAARLKIVRKLDQTGPSNTNRDVKITALNLHKNGIFTLPDILASVGFSERIFFHVLWLWQETGNVVLIDMATRLDAVTYFILMIFSISSI
jgi:hypothetical protein